MANGEREWIVGSDEAGERLDRWLAAPDRLGSRKRAAEALERGKVSVGGATLGVRDGGRLLAGGERIELWIDKPGTGRRSASLTDRVARERRGTRRAGLRILHEDADLIVVDKPAGLLTVARPGSERADDTVISRLEALLDAGGRRRLFVVHRIDRGTSGLVLLARHRRAADTLIAQFREQTPLRRYFAITAGGPSTPEEEWTDRLVTRGGARLVRVAREGEPGEAARCRVSVEERLPQGGCVLEATLTTGKRNQIRVQAALRGAPLLGDRLYRDLVPDGAPPEPVHSLRRGRLALHARALGFEHPATGERLELESELPADLQRCLEQLRRGDGGQS